MTSEIWNNIHSIIDIISLSELSNLSLYQNINLSEYDDSFAHYKCLQASTNVTNIDYLWLCKMHEVNDKWCCLMAQLITGIVAQEMINGMMLSHASIDNWESGTRDDKWVWNVSIKHEIFDFISTLITPLSTIHVKLQIKKRKKERPVILRENVVSIQSKKKKLTTFVFLIYICKLQSSPLYCVLAWYNHNISGNICNHKTPG